MSEPGVVALPTFQVEPSDILAVVDTNVLLDVYSCHDVARTYDKLGEDGAVNAPQAVYRRARARESLLLAIYFHKRRATTYSAGLEALSLMRANVDPDSETAAETHYTRLFLYFVRERVIPGWRAGQPQGADARVGTAIDNELLKYASANGLPLITNEGFKTFGLENDGLRKKATAQGVPVYTPREFYSGRFNEAAAIDGFLRRFRGQARQYVEAQPRPEVVDASLRFVYGYLRHVLLGETEGMNEPARIAVW